MFQCYLTIIVLMSYLSYLVPQYSLCTIVRYMKCILLVLTNHRHYFSIISSYTIRIMCSFYYYTSYCIVTVHTFLPPFAFLVFNSTPWFSKPHIDINYWAYPHKLVRYQDKYPPDKYPSDKYPPDKYPPDKYPPDKYPRENTPRTYTHHSIK